MVKNRTVFACQNCGHQSPKWLGRCPECGEWNSFVEETYQTPKSKGGHTIPLTKARPEKITDISAERAARLRTGINEFDNVLGGGIVPASFVLIGGDPGIGKSTLLLLAAGRLSSAGQTVLYVSGEESSSQIKMRAERLNIHSERLFVLCETSFENILDAVEKVKPSVVIIDSIQTVFTSELGSAPGSVSQVRETAGRLMLLAKNIGITTFLIGHVTKEGSIAGPRVLEHIVDTVLYFEGDTDQQFRVLRAHKNRFGSVSEIGLFRMESSGLVEVSNPSEFLLSDRSGGVSGSVVVCAMEGSRPLLIEIQALVSATPFGMPRRNTIGLDPYRINLLIAILEKRLDVSFLGYDVFLNVAGGIRINETSADLGVLMALYSSFRNTPVDSDVLLIGEVGLAGEVRPVPFTEQRIREAEKMGFKKVILPERNIIKKDEYKIEQVGVGWLKESIGAVFS